MDLVTVTCLRDINDMVRQAESISKFLEPCVHWVIVNEHKHIDLFRERLTPYYKRHILHLMHVANSTINDTDCGYRRQQMLKLYASSFIKEKYLILDSKNFFIRNTNILEFENQVGSGLTAHINETDQFYNTTESYKKIVGIDKTDTYYMAIETPFVIDPNILLTHGNIDTLLRQMSAVYPLMSEFLMYSLIYQKQRKCNMLKNEIGIFNSKHYTAFEKKIPTEDIIKIAEDPHVKVLGFHRNWFAETSSHELEIINQYLRSIGLTTLLKESNV